MAERKGPRTSSPANHQNPSFAIVDLETTGGSPKIARIIEIAIIVHNGRQVIEEFSTLVNPGQPIPPFIQGMTGISNDMVEEAPTFEEIHDKILSLTEGKIFVAHNVRFDYGMLRNEFKRMGMRFQRQQLCTVRLSRRFYPHLNSHSLGNLCQDLKIPVVNRHRAYGDAHATTVLLEQMLFNDRKELIRQMAKDEMAETILPPSITRKQVDELPEDTGVYSFLDERGKVLYVGKSRNIRKRVVNHFSNDLKKKRFAQMKDVIYDISYELTGSELIALLIESSEIKRWMPAYNKAQRKKTYSFGVYVEGTEETPFLTLRKINGEGEPIRKFTTRNAAVQFLQRMIGHYNLRPDYCYLPQQQWPPLPSMPTEIEHAEGLRQLLQSLQFPYESFLLLDQGRNFDEQAVLMVENEQLIGFAYIDEEFAPESPEQLREQLYILPDGQDMQQIVRKWIAQKKPKILPF
ncbi:MAG: DNA polymerase III subunit epsilon [Bacteroidetes bacterium SW_11_45_7]|nr:MAG: DNA polymerase III subunit epsilon [Bacteroidetes bacterium SW_11_45_7]